MDQTAFNIVLLRPEIPNNTGNIGRTAAATGWGLDTLPEGRESIDGVAGGGGAAGGYEPSAAAKAMMAAGGLGAPPAGLPGAPPADPSAAAKAHQLAMSEAKAAAAAPSAAPPNSPEAMRRGGRSDKGSPEGDIDRLVSVEGA